MQRKLDRLIERLDQLWQDMDEGEEKDTLSVLLNELETIGDDDG